MKLALTAILYAVVFSVGAMLVSGNVDFGPFGDSPQQVQAIEQGNTGSTLLCVGVGCYMNYLYNNNSTCYTSGTDFDDGNRFYSYARPCNPYASPTGTYNTNVIGNYNSNVWCGNVLCSNNTYNYNNCGIYGCNNNYNYNNVWCGNVLCNNNTYNYNYNNNWCGSVLCNNTYNTNNIWCGSVLCNNNNNGYWSNGVWYNNQYNNNQIYYNTCSTYNIC